MSGVAREWCQTKRVQLLSGGTQVICVTVVNCFLRGQRGDHGTLSNRGVGFITILSRP